MQHDLNDLDDLQPSDKSGEYALWLRVLTLSFFELKKHHYHQAARDFLFDEENYFFEVVAAELGYEPDTLRKRIRGALGRS